jgi:hypothetical protein
MSVARLLSYVRAGEDGALSPFLYRLLVPRECGVHVARARISTRLSPQIANRDAGARVGSEVGGGEGTAEESPPAGRVTDETNYFRLADQREAGQSDQKERFSGTVFKTRVRLL